MFLTGHDLIENRLIFPHTSRCTNIARAGVYFDILESTLLIYPHGHLCHSSPMIGIGFFFTIDRLGHLNTQYCSFYGTNRVTFEWSRETIRREIHHRK